MTVYNLDTPEPLYGLWQLYAPLSIASRPNRYHQRYNEVIVDLLVADYLCRREHGRGAVDILLEEEYLDEDDVDLLHEDGLDFDQLKDAGVIDDEEINALERD